MGMTKMSQRRSGRREMMMMRDLSMYKHFPRLAERPRPPRPPSGAATSQAPKDPMRYRRGAPAGAPAGALLLVARDNAVRIGDLFVPIPKSIKGPQPGSKSWGAFANLKELAEHINCLKPELLNVYEVCMGSRPRRLGFDLEQAIPEVSPDHF